MFASRFLIAQITSPIGLAIAGPLADFVFEAAMQSGGILAGMLGGGFGIDEGSGMALQYILFSLLGSAIASGSESKIRSRLLVMGFRCCEMWRRLSPIIKQNSSLGMIKHCY
ncbi:MAG: hypothetical protein F6K03_12310 [Kamptonema sp. SIO4C4]|nr:hypothetical protein [Kamptonema sp. SIO4C4]